MCHTTMLRYFFYLPLSMILLLGSGCSTLPRQERFMPSQVSIKTRHSERVLVEVDTVTNSASNAAENTRGISPVPDAKFINFYRNALSSCITTTGLFVVSTQDKEADLVLRITILRMSEESGYNTPSSSTLLMTHWSLRNKRDGKVLYEKDHTTTGTHDAPDYMWGGIFNCTRDSLEGAAAANIAQGLEWLDRRAQSLVIEKPTVAGQP